MHDVCATQLLPRVTQQSSNDDYDNMHFSCIISHTLRWNTPCRMHLHFPFHLSLIHESLRHHRRIHNQFPPFLSSPGVILCGWLGLKHQLTNSIFLCSPLPSGTWRTPGLSFLMLSSHLFFYLPCLLPHFTAPCKMVFARPDERETCPYHFGLRLFTVVRRSSFGLIICWILTRTSSLVTWSLYEMRSILR